VLQMHTPHSFLPWARGLPGTPPSRFDTCPLVPNKNQRRWLCDTSIPGHRCHPACATGCTKPNSRKACTTAWSNGAQDRCTRCKANYHPKGGATCAPNVMGVLYVC
jgi:hypothetical protein